MVAFYSPVEQFQGKEKCQKFTAVGEVKTGQAYKFEMAPDFHPFRMDLKFYDHQKEAPVRPLLERLSFLSSNSQSSAKKVNNSWGWIFRRGQFEIPKRDFEVIAEAMGVNMTSAAKIEDSNRGSGTQQSSNSEQEGLCQL